jgi:hypothetical protein
VYSYAFGFKLVGRVARGRVDFSRADRQLSIFCPGESGTPSDTFLFTSRGYETEQAANVSMWAQFLNCKLSLLRDGIPHVDWFSLDATAKLGIDTINGLFQKGGVAPLSLHPTVYPSNRLPHWHGAILANEEIDLKRLRDACINTTELPVQDTAVYEAMNVLGLALAEPFEKSKLILSMTAIEILAGGQRKASEPVIDALDKLAAFSATLNLPELVAKDILKVLNNGRSESISASCRRFVAQHLGEQTEKELSKLYDYRSRAVHGSSRKRKKRDRTPSAMYEKSKQAFDLALTLMLMLLSVNSASGVQR